MQWGLHNATNCMVGGYTKKCSNHRTVKIGGGRLRGGYGRLPGTIRYSHQPDKKFNIVIYGLEECPKGTPKHERFNRDMENIMTVISSGRWLYSSPSGTTSIWGNSKTPTNCSSVDQGPSWIDSLDLPTCSVSFLRDGSLQQPFPIKPKMSPEESSHDMKER